MDSRSKLVWALAVLLVIEFLHGLDELRTDDTATFISTLTGAAGLLGLTGTIVALVAVARGLNWGPTLAKVTGVLVALGFVVVHGIPTASEATAPYWGDGSADAIQWIGVIAVWIACAVVVTLARRSERVPASA